MTTVSVSRQIQRPAERKVVILAVSSASWCLRCPQLNSSKSGWWMGQSGELLYTPTCHRNRKLLPWAMVPPWKYSCCSHDRDRQTRSAQSVCRVHICSDPVCFHSSAVTHSFIDNISRKCLHTHTTWGLHKENVCRPLRYTRNFNPESIFRCRNLTPLHEVLKFKC